MSKKRHRRAHVPRKMREKRNEQYESVVDMLKSHAGCSTNLAVFMPWVRERLKNDKRVEVWTHDESRALMVWVAD